MYDRCISFLIKEEDFIPTYVVRQHNVRYLNCIVFLSFIGGLVNKRKLFTVIFGVVCYVMLCLNLPLI